MLLRLLFFWCLVWKALVEPWCFCFSMFFWKSLGYVNWRGSGQVFLLLRVRFLWKDFLNRDEGVAMTAFCFGLRLVGCFFFSLIMTGLAAFILDTAAKELETESNFLCWMTDTLPFGLCRRSWWLLSPWAKSLVQLHDFYVFN